MSNNYTVGDVVEVDPKALVIGTNVRTDVHDNAREFAQSIKQRGVLQVITAYETDDGTLTVDRGQRRTLVAASVGTPTGTVKVLVVEPPQDADRIVDQLAENLHREAMHDGEVVAAVEQLALLGVSAAQIAKRTAIRRPRVDAALTVSGSQTGREQIAKGTLTLDQAALIAEFDGDEDATSRLLEAAERGRPLEHLAQRLRDERAEATALAAEVERLRAGGLPVLDPSDAPAGLYDVRIENLRDADGNEIPPERWASTDGAAVVVKMQWDSVEVTAEDGETSYESEWKPVANWIVPDPGSVGLHHRDDSSPATRSEEQVEADLAERRLVRENNAAWRSAETVRRQWLRQFFTRKTAPDGAEAVICEAVVTARFDLSQAFTHHHRLLLDLFGEDATGFGASAKACTRLATDPKTPRAQTMRTLAAVVAAWEDCTDVHTWRNPSAWDARMLTALIGWGYEASPVERILLGEEPVDEADAA